MRIEVLGTSLTPHFSISEYGDKSVKTSYINYNSMRHSILMERLRQYLGKPIYVTGWYRTYSTNKRVGGINGSNHLKGCATDCYIIGLNEAKFIEIAKYWKRLCKEFGVSGECGYYPQQGFMHLGSCFANNPDYFVNWRTDSRGQHNGYYNSKL